MDSSEGAVDSNKKLFYTTAELERTSEGEYKCLACLYTSKKSTNTRRHISVMHSQFVHTRRSRFYTSVDLNKVDGQYKCVCCSYATSHLGDVNKHIISKHPQFVLKEKHFRNNKLQMLNENTDSGIKIWNEDELSDPEKKLFYTTSDLEKEDGRYKCFVCPYMSPQISPIIRHITLIHPRFIHESTRGAKRDDSQRAAHVDIDIWTKEDLSDTSKKLFYTTSNLRIEEGKYKCFSCSFSTSSIDKTVRHISKNHPRFIHRPMPRNTAVHRVYPRQGIKTWTQEELASTKILFYNTSDLERVNGIYKCFGCLYSSKHPVDVNRHIKRKHTRFVYKSAPISGARHQTDIPSPLSNTKSKCNATDTLIGDGELSDSVKLNVNRKRKVGSLRLPSKRLPKRKRGSPRPLAVIRSTDELCSNEANDDTSAKSGHIDNEWETNNQSDEESFFSAIGDVNSAEEQDSLNYDLGLVAVKNEPCDTDDTLFEKSCTSVERMENFDDSTKTEMAIEDDFEYSEDSRSLEHVDCLKSSPNSVQTGDLNSTKQELSDDGLCGCSLYSNKIDDFHSAVEFGTSRNDNNCPDERMTSLGTPLRSWVIPNCYAECAQEIKRQLRQERNYVNNLMKEKASLTIELQWTKEQLVKNLTASENRFSDEFRRKNEELYQVIDEKASVDREWREKLLKAKKEAEIQANFHSEAERQRIDLLKKMDEMGEKFTRDLQDLKARHLDEMHRKEQEISELIEGLKKNEEEYREHLLKSEEEVATLENKRMIDFNEKMFDMQQLLEFERERLKSLEEIMSNQEAQFENTVREKEADLEKAKYLFTKDLEASESRIVREAKQKEDEIAKLKEDFERKIKDEQKKLLETKEEDEIQINNIKSLAEQRVSDVVQQLDSEREISKSLETMMTKQRTEFEETILKKEAELKILTAETDDMLLGVMRLLERERESVKRLEELASARTVQFEAAINEKDSELKVLKAYTDKKLSEVERLLSCETEKIKDLEAVIVNINGQLYSKTEHCTQLEVQWKRREEELMDNLINAQDELVKCQKRNALREEIGKLMTQEEIEEQRLGRIQEEARRELENAEKAKLLRKRELERLNAEFSMAGNNKA